MLRSYSPKDVIVSINGIPLTGYAPDTFVSISRNAELVEEEVGSDGSLSLTKIADKTGEITIMLQQTSPTNTALSAAALVQEYATDEIVPMVITILDPSGSILCAATNSYFKSYPSMDVGSSQNAREWIFGCEDLVFGSLIV